MARLCGCGESEWARAGYADTLMSMGCMYGARDGRGRQAYQSSHRRRHMLPRRVCHESVSRHGGPSDMQLPYLSVDHRCDLMI